MGLGSVGLLIGGGSQNLRRRVKFEVADTRDGVGQGKASASASGTTRMAWEGQEVAQIRQPLQWR